MLDNRVKEAKKFVERWKDILPNNSEKQKTQSFWYELLEKVFNIDLPTQYISFEEEVKLKNTSFVDGCIPSANIIIEQKKKSANLNKRYLQSDGTYLTPFEQAKRYDDNNVYSKKARWIITCNFDEFYIYDMDKRNPTPHILKLEDLPKYYSMLNILIDSSNQEIIDEIELSKDAGEIIKKLYNAILEKYKDKESEETLRSLNILLVRLVFLWYAEDSNILQCDSAFTKYIEKVDAIDLNDRLIKLFKILDINDTDGSRPDYISPELNAFPWINGGLFRDEDIEIPLFDDNIKNIMVNVCGKGFNWSTISPTIFGAVFESTLNPVTRREGGMHYTSIENIQKIIKPLFLDKYTNKLNDIKLMSNKKERKEKAKEFIDEISRLSFLDPACGSGNFLTETYISLRRLENDALRIIYDGEKKIFNDTTNCIKVSIDNFYGIEINNFATTVAKTAMWIAEHQMLLETEEILVNYIKYLPLRHYVNIYEGNALDLDWDAFVNTDIKNYYSLSHNKNELLDYVDAINSEDYKRKLNYKKVDYIIGNPPFVGARLMTKKQKDEMLKVFGKDWENIGNLDYVCAWYKKAVDYINNVAYVDLKKVIRCAFVSTNSICQGSSVADLWEPLFKDGLCIDFCHRTFKWNNEANEKAAVFCIIIGFHIKKDTERTSIEKIIFDNGMEIKCKNINAYLMDYDDVFIKSRSKVLCNVPEISIGNQPIDDGNYLFTKEEMEVFVKKEPNSEKYFKRWYGSDEFINNKPRYCLWLGECSPSEIKSMPLCYERVKNVMKYRQNSTRKATLKLANTPTRFQTENMPKSTYLLIPEVTTSKRSYIPIGYMDKNDFASNLVKIISGASLYNFSILTSIVHMAWVRIVCGRLGDGYRYSKDIVYNNFPWPIDLTMKEESINNHSVKKLIDNGYPTINKKQKDELMNIGKSILEARNKYKDSSLADLYDPNVMPQAIDLYNAHINNDKKVLEIYGFDKTKEGYHSIEECVKVLFKYYLMLTK